MEFRNELNGGQEDSDVYLRKRYEEEEEEEGRRAA